MKIYILIIFILGALLSFGTSVIANGYLTSWTAENTRNEPHSVRVVLAN